MEYLQTLKTKKPKRNRNYNCITRLREKPSQILLIPTMTAFCLQILIVLTYWGLHTPFTCTVSIVIAQTSCHIAVDESNHNQLTNLIAANQWNFANLEGKL